MESVRHALTLGQGDILRITDSRGLVVRVAQGKIWLTEEGDRRDILVRAGESFRLERVGLALVYALEPAALALCGPTERDWAEPLGRFSVVAVGAAC
jgi:hypothetical protein